MSSKTALQRKNSLASKTLAPDARFPGAVSTTEIGGSAADFNKKQTERLALTDEDHQLLADLDPAERAPLVAMLKQVHGAQLPPKLSPDAAEELLDQLLHGTDPQRKRGLSRWSQVRGVASHGLSVVGEMMLSKRDSFRGGGEDDRIDDAVLGEESGGLMMADGIGGGGGLLHHGGSGRRRSSSADRTAMLARMTPEERRAHEEALFAAHMEEVAGGVKRISDRHKERTMRLRLANRDVDDIATQAVNSRGARVVTTTGRPPPSHAVDAVGGIKQEVKVTHGEPPLMVLRQELEDRQALAAAMPRIRARVAEMMGKMQKQQMSRPRSRPASAASFRPPSSRGIGGGGNSSSNRMHHQHQHRPNTPGSNSFSTIHSPAGSPPPPGTAGRSSSSNGRPGTPPRAGRSDRDISEIARKLKLRSDAIREEADKQHAAQVEKRRAASSLRRELVSGGCWCDIKVVSMFRPPVTVKHFVSSWSEFKQNVLQAVSPLPPGCTFASLSYISGVGAKSVIDPRHPLLRPLRSFEAVKACKTRDGTCASLTVSVAIRAAGDGGNSNPDGFVV